MPVLRGCTCKRAYLTILSKNELCTSKNPLILYPAGYRIYERLSSSMFGSSCCV